MQVADEHGEKPGIWEEYVLCIERKLAAAYEKSLTASLRFLISLISGFRAREANFVSAVPYQSLLLLYVEILEVDSLLDICMTRGTKPRPMFKLKVVVREDGKISVGDEFGAICDYLYGLPTHLSNNKDIVLLEGRAPVKLFVEEQSGNEIEGIETSFKSSMSRAKVDVAAYFRTLSSLEDFVSLRPDAVLGYYTDSDAFIRSCEGDVLKLRETRLSTLYAAQSHYLQS